MGGQDGAVMLDDGCPFITIASFVVNGIQKKKILTKLGLVDEQLLSQLKKSGWKVCFFKFNYCIVNILNTENSQPLLCSD